MTTAHHHYQVPQELNEPDFGITTVTLLGLDWHTTGEEELAGEMLEQRVQMHEDFIRVVERLIDPKVDPAVRKADIAEATELLTQAKRF